MSQRSRFRSIAKTALWFIGGVVLISAGWVGLYGFIDPPLTTPMASDYWAERPVSRVPARLAEIGSPLIHAVIAAEDGRFCDHGGFDFEEMQDALAQVQAGGAWRGASTISQQVAKNAFLWHDPAVVRKPIEAWFTLLIEVLWSKPRILEVYLNIAEWGPGIYGAEAAARHHYGKPARDLSRAEAAQLASILPNPKGWRPTAPALRSRQMQIQRFASDAPAIGAACLEG